MTTHDARRETPDWMPHAAHCRTCGSDDWHSDCHDLDTPPTIIRGED